MPEKNVSVKCEVNEKNKDIIKHALCDALGIYPYLWQGGSFEGEGGGDGVVVKYKIKMSEAPDSSGYYLQIVIEPSPTSLKCSLLGLFISITFWVICLKNADTSWCKWVCVISGVCFILCFFSLFAILSEPQDRLNRIDDVINALNMKSTVKVQRNINIKG